MSKFICSVRSKQPVNPCFFIFQFSDLDDADAYGNYFFRFARFETCVSAFLGISIYLQYSFGSYNTHIPQANRKQTSNRKGIGKPINFLGLKPSELRYRELHSGCATMSGREKRKIETLLKRKPGYTTDEISSEVFAKI